MERLRRDQEAGDSGNKWHKGINIQLDLHEDAGRFRKRAEREFTRAEQKARRMAQHEAWEWEKQEAKLRKVCRVAGHSLSSTRKFRHMYACSVAWQALLLHSKSHQCTLPAAQSGVGIQPTQS